MSRQLFALTALALLLSACGTDKSMIGAPSYDPANAVPPTVTVASDQLTGPPWQWQGLSFPDGRNVRVGKPDSYTIRFEGGGRYFLQADCNRGGGAYEVNAGTIRMGPAALTRMACPQGSQDNAFVSALARASGYTVANGELRLTLVDGATMVFRRGG